MTEVFGTVAGTAPQRVWDGVTGRAIHGAALTLSVVELAPGGVVPEHRHEHEQVGILVEGELTFRVGDETRALRPGATWAIPADVPHEVRVGAAGAVVIEAFAPARSDWRALPGAEADAPRWPR